MKLNSNSKTNQEFSESSDSGLSLVHSLTHEKQSELSNPPRQSETIVNFAIPCSKEAKINFKVIYKKKKYDISLSPDTDIATLKTHLQPIIDIPRETMKVIIKGLAKDEMTLKFLGVTNGSKLMVVGSSLKDVLQFSSASKGTSKAEEILNSQFGIETIQQTTSDKNILTFAHFPSSINKYALRQESIISDTHKMQLRRSKREKKLKYQTMLESLFDWDITSLEDYSDSDPDFETSALDQHFKLQYESSETGSSNSNSGDESSVEDLDIECKIQGVSASNLKNFANVDNVGGDINLDQKIYTNESEEEKEDLKRLDDGKHEETDEEANGC